MDVVRRLALLFAFGAALATAAATQGQDGDYRGAPAGWEDPDDLDELEGRARPGARTPLRTAQATQVTPPPVPAPAPPAAPPTPPPPPPARRAFFTLASAPFMFGDQPPFTNGPIIEPDQEFPNGNGRIEDPVDPIDPGEPPDQNGRIEPSDVFADTGRVPLAAAGRRFRIAENNSPFPQNRVFFMFNHFHNLLAVESFAPARQRRTSSLNRYIVGIEQTFGAGLWSVDVRVPFTSGHNVALGDFAARGGSFGNVNVALKRLVYRTEAVALAAGLGVNTPTGSDVTGRLGTARYRLHNDAVYLSPFVGLLETPTDRLFWMAFAQLDFDLNGNRVMFDDGTGRRRVGTLNDQALLALDASIGYWLHRNPEAAGITGIATQVELHYLTALQNADVVTAVNQQTGDRVRFGNPVNRFDVLNMTVGLHTEIANRTSVRVGGVFPLRRGDNRLFDAEVQASVNVLY